MTDKEFQFLGSFMSKVTGIVLTEKKKDMVCGRLVRRLRALDLDSFADYCDYLKGDGAEEEIEHLVNAITTNVTNFFREPHHFDNLRDLVLTPRLSERPRQPRLRIWSAGCSSGEEPYSMAMTIAETLRPMAEWDALILATDIDTNVLQRGEAGIYPAGALGQIPNQYHRRFTSPAGEDKIQMTDDLREMIRFRRLNLHENWPMKGKFDAIFCRNVAIYFDKPTQRKLFSRYAEMLNPGGLLCIGHSESLMGVSEQFEPLEKTAYRRIV